MPLSDEKIDSLVIGIGWFYGTIFPVGRTKDLVKNVVMACFFGTLGCKVGLHYYRCIGASTDYTDTYCIKSGYTSLKLNYFDSGVNTVKNDYDRFKI